MRRLQPTYDKLRDLVLISDPGFFRLRAALRGVLAVLLSVFILWEISEFGHRPFLFGLVGAMIAMNGSMAADDRTVRQQKLTALLIIPCSIFGLGLGVLLSPWHYVTLGALLLFTFVGIFLRKYGVRWTNLGGVLYTTFFASIFFRVPQDQTSFVVLGIFIAGLFSYAVKFWVIPDRARSSIAWSLSAFRAGLRRFVRECRRELERRKDNPNRETLRPRMVRVSELALVSEDAILNASDALPGSASLVRALQGKLFDLELSARKIFESFNQRTDDDIEKELATLERDFRQLKSNQQALVAEEEALAAAAETESAIGTASTTPNSAAGLGANTRYTPLGSRFDFQTRQAIQATIATAIAAVLGTMISSDRWYWAPLTAYIVFNGTTRGDSLRRAFHRLAGTIVGVIAGMWLANALHGERDLEIIALFVSMFLAIFTVKISYSLYAVFLTSLVAIFYSLLNLLTPEIMYLRIEQTLIGGACGAITAFLVLPVSTRVSLRIELAKLFHLLSHHLNEVVSKPLPRRVRRHHVRALERELQTLRTIAGPLKGPFGRPAREETRIVVHRAASLVHFARQLIVFFPDEDSDQIREGTKQLAARSQVLSERVEHAEFVDITLPDTGGVVVGGTSAGSSITESWTEESPFDQHTATYSLSRLAQSISAFETRFRAKS